MSALSLNKMLSAQFRRPTGALGALAGAVMATRKSNQARNLWTLDLIDVQPTDRVLDFGCGPGWALAQAAERAGYAVGLDHSATMCAQATRRNRAAIKAGRAEVRCGGAEALAAFERPFDAVYSANVVQFLPDPDAAFAAFRAALGPSGRVATTFQPRLKSSPEEAQAAALSMADRIESWTRAAGFTDVRREELPLPGAPAICVLGGVAA